MCSRVRGNKKGRFGEHELQVEVGGGRRVGRGGALQGRRGVSRGPGSYGRGQGYGRGQEGHDGEKDGMGQEKEDGMDGEMALHAIPTIGDNHDQHGHWNHILGLEMQKKTVVDPCLMSLERPL